MLSVESCVRKRIGLLLPLLDYATLFAYIGAGLLLSISMEQSFSLSELSKQVEDHHRDSGIEIKNEASELRELVEALMNESEGERLHLPNGADLCVVRLHQDGKEYALEWMDQDGKRISGYTLRDKDKRILAESETGSVWKYGASGESFVASSEDSLHPSAVFTESVPYRATQED